MARDQDRSDKKPKPSDNFLKYSSLGLQLVFLLAIAGWLGFRIDQSLSLKVPIFLIVFVIAAFAGFMIRLYKSINKP